ncbi:Cellulose binding domain-containing protein [Pseudobutyrivibrio sp. NOR37]|uniref:CBM2 domain-containing protein n=1 Tax=Pseudobutyrivibrio xylanivorans TaxID=185007 RepID=A0A6M0LE91_PSEXY|nr:MULTISPECIES: cellulose binding domain-containing protein [Pseudobutyrivibrio]NEX00952.1 hypothetical protein [Pseudobutyrivibrio xylanivorans]SFR63924.1 Cellulose binding domain-containing protein [Pseudobutyrivibrio sp. NOR37]
MKKRLSHIMCVGLAICMIFTLAAPITVRAEENYDAYSTTEAEDAHYLYDCQVKTEDDTTYLAMKPNDTFSDYYCLDRGYKSFELTYRAKTPTSLTARIYREGGPSFMYILLEPTDGKFVTKTYEIKYPRDRYYYDLTFSCGRADLEIDSYRFIASDEENVDENVEETEDTPVSQAASEEKGNTIKCDVNKWSNGGSANVVITNESNNTSEGWKVKVKKGDFEIDCFWSANMVEEDDYYIFTPCDWNKSICPGDSVQFGFNISGNFGDSIDYTLE